MLVQKFEAQTNYINPIAKSYTTAHFSLKGPVKEFHKVNSIGKIDIYKFDTDGLLISYKPAHAHVSLVYSYDEKGRLISTENQANGDLTLFTYTDDSDKIKEMNFNDVQFFEYRYDSSGNLLGTYTKGGVPKENSDIYKYNNQNELIETTFQGVKKPKYHYTYSYVNKGNVLEVKTNFTDLTTGKKNSFSRFYKNGVDYGFDDNNNIKLDSYGNPITVLKWGKPTTGENVYKYY